MTARGQGHERGTQSGRAEILLEQARVYLVELCLGALAPVWTNCDLETLALVHVLNVMRSMRHDVTFSAQSPVH